MIVAPLMLAGCTLLAGCAGGDYTPQPLTEKQAASLEKSLAGKVPGEKVSCINRFPQSDLKIISSNVLLYKVSSKLTYRNDLIGSCSGLSRGDTLIVKSYSSQYCRGDMASSADLNSGMLTGSCALGDFTPYRPAK